MKKHAALPVGILLVCTLMLSFTKIRGGDTFEIYLNGRQVHQQFVHVDNSAKTIRLTELKGTDKVGVLYSHCGQSGTNRVVVLRNEKNELIKTLHFPNAAGRSIMTIPGKEFGKNHHKVLLYYMSKELPHQKLLATLTWETDEHLAKAGL